MGGVLLGWRTVCAVELDPYCRSVLLARQRDGHLPRFPIWDDVRTFDGRPWRGRVDVISGGFPCQDISVAGSGAGINGTRSGLWGEMARVVAEVRPRWVLVENSPALTVRGLHVVLGALAEMGFDAEWGRFSACSLGAPHMRKRLFILAYAASVRRARCQAPNDREARHHERWLPQPERGGGWAAEPDLARVADGVANGVDRVRAIGNGQVPAVAAMAFTMLSRRLMR